MLLISGSGGLRWLQKRRVTVYVCHIVFKTKPERDFGISCPLLYCLKSYLNGRQQVTVVNGVHPRILTGVPQGSVLGPTLFAMFMNDSPKSVVSGMEYIFAADTTIYCIGTLADEATAQLNLAMHELYSWCLPNKLTPHQSKSELGWIKAWVKNCCDNWDDF